MENESITVPASSRLRYGVEPSWVEKVASGTIVANNEFFGRDPIHGVVKLVERLIAAEGDAPAGSPPMPPATDPMPAPTPGHSHGTTTPAPVSGDPLPPPTLATHIEVHGERVPWVGARASERLTGSQNLVGIDDPNGRVCALPGTAVEITGKVNLLDLGMDAGSRLFVRKGAVLSYRTLQWLPGASLVVEPGATLIQRRVPLDSDDDWKFGGGLLGHGRYDIRGTRKGKRYIRLARAPKKGDRTLLLSEPATGWQVGDRLIVPGTKQDGNWDRSDVNRPIFVDDNERVLIREISPDLLTLTLDRPLAFDHPGSAVDRRTGRQHLPHIGNMTCDTNFLHEPGAEWHFMLFATSSGKIDGTRIVGAGRTRMNTASDATQGWVGQNGRHGLHFHHARNYEVFGCVLEDMGHWPLTLHGSHGKGGDLLIVGSRQDILSGPAVVCEDGTETGELDGVMVVAPRGLDTRRATDKLMQSATGAWANGRGVTIRNFVTYRASAAVKSYDGWFGPQVRDLFPGVEAVGCDRGVVLFSEAGNHPQGTVPTDFRFRDGVAWNCTEAGLSDEFYNHLGRSADGLSVLFDPEASQGSSGVRSFYLGHTSGFYVQGAGTGWWGTTGRGGLTRRIRDYVFNVPARARAIDLETEMHYSPHENAVDIFNVRISDGAKIRYTLRGWWGDPVSLFDMGPRILTQRQVTVRNLNGDPANSWWIFADEQRGGRLINEYPYMVGTDWVADNGWYNLTAQFTDVLNVETGPDPKGYPGWHYAQKYNLELNGLCLPPDGVWRGRKVERLPWMEDCVGVRMTPEEAATDPLPAWEKTHGQTTEGYGSFVLHEKDARLGALRVTATDAHGRVPLRCQVWVADTPKGDRALVYDSIVPHPKEGRVVLPKELGDGRKRFYFLANVTSDGGTRFEKPRLIEAARLGLPTHVEGWHAFEWTCDPATQDERGIKLVGDLVADLYRVTDEDRAAMGRPFTTPQEGTVPLLFCLNSTTPEGRYYFTNPAAHYAVQGVAGWVYDHPVPGGTLIFQHEGRPGETYESYPSPQPVWGRVPPDPAASPHFWLPPLDPSKAPPVDWVHLGWEGDQVTVPENTRVRYGAAGLWVEKIVSGRFVAGNGFFGDPAPGIRKQAQRYVGGG